MTARDITRLIVPLVRNCERADRKMKKLILASASPRRKELLEQIGLEAEVIIAHADEHTENRIPDALVRELAARKCFAVADCLANEKSVRNDWYVLGADTVVVHGDEVLGKPSGPEQAKEMLYRLQGDIHRVYTGVCILRIANADAAPGGDSGHRRLFSVCTEVKVNPMTKEEIRSYVATGEPLDKAGAYGIQGRFARHIAGIRGDYTNVVGLPVSSVYAALRELCFFEACSADSAGV